MVKIDQAKGAKYYKSDDLKTIIINLILRKTRGKSQLISIFFVLLIFIFVIQQVDFKDVHNTELNKQNTYY